MPDIDAQRRAVAGIFGGHTGIDRVRFERCNFQYLGAVQRRGDESIQPRITPVDDSLTVMMMGFAHTFSPSRSMPRASAQKAKCARTVCAPRDRGRETVAHLPRHARCSPEAKETNHGDDAGSCFRK